VRVVLDANVIIAAFASRGLCESILEVCLSDHELIVSEHLLAEVRRHLVRRVKLPQAVAEDIVTLLREEGSLFEPARVRVDACRDADDLAILGLAVASGADCLVTGDKDLLDLRRFQGIPICSPRAFADRLR